MSDRSRILPAWVTPILYLAAAYNLIWGAIVLAWPLAIFRWAEMEAPRYPEIWQCVGMVVGVYGVGYGIAARDPMRHWPLVFVGLLGKVLGPIGFLRAAVAGQLPWVWGVTVLTNDLLWWVPFAAILYHAFRFHNDTSSDHPAVPYDAAIRDYRSHRGASLLEISNRQPTLVVFLRHAGCTFCRQALADLSRRRATLESAGVALVIVHMGSPMDGTLMLHRFGLEGVHQISDPHCVLYRAFGLERANWRRVFSLSVIRRAIPAIVAGHGLGKLAGDGFRMPGVFLLRKGEIQVARRAETAADRPDYLELACGTAGSAAGSERPGAGNATNLFSPSTR